MAKLSKGKYLFDIGAENEQYFNNGIAVYITPIDYWKENGVLADHYTDEEVDELDPILDDIGLAEVMQSTYETTKNISEDALRDKMIEAGFIEDESFSEYIESFKSYNGDSDDEESPYEDLEEDSWAERDI